MKLKQLINSKRWVSFLESTAAGLHLNLALLDESMKLLVQAPEVCPSCHYSFSSFSGGDLSLIRGLAPTPSQGNTPPGERSLITEQGESILWFTLRENGFMIIRSCKCIEDKGFPDLHQRTNIAQKLLTNFLTAFSEEVSGGQSALELSTLRQMNQIVLSLSRGESDAAKKAFDLILSALVIMLDAEASWLEYHDGLELRREVKGDLEALEDCLRSKNISDIMEIEIMSPQGTGCLRVLRPGNPGRAELFLPLMAQECSIVFEIERLFRLLQTQLSRLLGALNSAVLLIDERMHILYLNQAAEEMLGKRAVEVIGSSIGQLPDFWAKPLQGKLESPMSDSRVIFGAEENLRLIDWQILPLRDEQKIAGWLVIADDRTEFYHWQEIGRGAESFMTIASIIGPLAHEIRNPLAATKGLLQLMQRRKEPEKTAGYLDLVLREIDRMNLLVNELLQLGRTTQVNFSEADLFIILQEITPLLDGEAAASEVEITYILETTPLIFADQGQITQVILNLVRNAIEAAGTGGKVGVSLRNSDGWVMIEVADNGPGIKPEVMERLFQPFFTTKERGTGLGLAVTRAIITNHGGKISAANISGSGASFSVKLPVRKEPQKCCKTVDVLIDVTDQMIRFPVEQVLQAAGFSTMIALNHHEIFEKKRDILPRVIISDTLVPREQIHQIKLIWPGVKYIMIGQLGHYQEMTDIQFLVKPVNYARLIEVVRLVVKENESKFTS